MNCKSTAYNEHVNTVGARILRHIWEEGAVSRTDIAASLGLAKATVTKVVNRLISHNVLTETGEEVCEHGTMKQGRRRVLVDFDLGKRFILGVHIGTDLLSVGLTTLRGDCLGKVNKPLSGIITPGEVNSQIISATEGLVKDSCITTDRILAAGIAAEPALMEELGLDDYSVFEDDVRTIIDGEVYSGNSAALTALTCAEYDGGINKPYSRAVLTFSKGKVYMTEIGENSLFEKEMYSFKDISRAFTLQSMLSEPHKCPTNALGGFIANVYVIGGTSRVGLCSIDLSEDYIPEIEDRTAEFTKENMTGKLFLYNPSENHLYRAGSCYASLMTYCRSDALFRENGE